MSSEKVSIRQAILRPPDKPIYDVYREQGNILVGEIYRFVNGKLYFKAIPEQIIWEDEYEEIIRFLKEGNKNEKAE